ncbi:hypothetical protein Btru_076176 [Bulinus truncatus]|nr:hypothetical protein Btru_076176 [Bulinus truncatus]
MSRRLCIITLVFLLVCVDLVSCADINDCIVLITEAERPNNKQTVLTLKCQLEQCSEVNNLRTQSLKISKIGDENDILLASIEKSKNVASRAMALGGAPKVSGNMKKNRDTYLAIQWEHPDTDLEGQYSCVISVIDKNGDKRNLEAKYYLFVEEPKSPTDDNGNPKKAEDCEKQLAEDNDIIANLKEKVKDLQRELDQKDSKGGEMLED